MLYEYEKINRAFKIYSILSAEGQVQKDDIRYYLADDDVRSLVDSFAKEVDSVVIVAGDYIYLIPIAVSSIFHISNERIKKDFLPSRSRNTDIYLMYLVTIILFGEFYDSYHSLNPTRDFISLDDWLNQVNERLLSIKDHDKEEFIELEREYEYNWINIIDKWDSIDDVRENRKQDARTASRIAFLNITRKFLNEQGLIIDIGNNEIELTEKAKTVIQRYYMEYEYNRGILDFIYGLRDGKEESTDAVNI